MEGHKNREIHCNSIVSHKKVLFLYTFLVMVVSLYNLPNLNQLYVLHDEFGYWANAAHFAGCDWSEIASLSPYYSYGYSLFLVPFLLLFQNSILMYKAAICLNMVFYVGAFLLSVFCARKLFPKVNLYVTQTVCLIASFYCNNLVQVNLTWSEALLYVWFWLIFATVLCYQKEQNWKYGILLVLELIFLYMIHQRTLGVVIAGICTMIYLVIVEKKIDIKKICLLVGILVISILFAGMIKNLLMEHVWVWENTDVASSNDYAGQWGKLKSIFLTWSGFQNLLSSLGGKIFYLLTGSCGIIFFAVWSCGASIWKKVLQNENGIWVFSILSLLFTVGISAIFWWGGARIDGVLYGRYSEFVMGPLLLVGMMYLLENRPSGWSFTVCVGLTFLCGFLANRQIVKSDTFTYYQSVGNSLFFDAETGIFQILQCIIVTMVMAFLLYLAARCQKKVVYIIAGVIVVTFWFTCSRCVLGKQINYGERYVKDITCVADAIEDIDMEQPVYFVYNEEASYFNWRIEHIQFLLPEKKFEKIDISEVDSLSGEYFLIQYGTDYLDLSQYEVITQGYGMVLMVPTETELAEEAKAYLSENPYQFADTMMISETAQQPFTFEADHVEGFLVFCQDLQLSAGVYEVCMELQVEELTDSNPIGYYDMSYNYGENTQSRCEVTNSAIQEDGSVSIVYTFECEEAVKHAEFRFYSYGNAKVEMEGLEYRRVFDCFLKTIPCIPFYLSTPLP